MISKIVFYKMAIQTNNKWDEFNILKLYPNIPNTLC